jgi:hypothetical protein
MPGAAITARRPLAVGSCLFAAGTGCSLEN